MRSLTSCFTLAFAMLTLTFWLALYFNLSLHQLSFVVPITFGILLFAIIKMPNKVLSKSSDDTLPQSTAYLHYTLPSMMWGAVLLAGAGLLLYPLKTSYSGTDPFFLISSIFCFVGFIAMAFFAAYSNTQATPPVQQPAKPGSNVNAIWLVLSCALMAISYVLLDYYNSDDSHFISYVATSLQNPHLPLMSVDGIFNSQNSPVIYSLNFGESYHALIALISYYSGIDHLAVYYGLPLLWLPLVPYSWYLFLGLFFDKNRGVAVFLTVVTLLMWGTFNHLHGFFFVPRLYQGKAMLLALLLPLLIYCCFKLTENANTKTIVQTFAVLICCAGASTTGVYLAILVMGLVILSSLLASKFDWYKLRKAIVVTVCGSVFMGIIIVNILLSIKGTQPVPFPASLANLPFEFIKDSVSEKPYVRPIDSIYWLFGNQHYLLGCILLCCATLASAALCRAKQKPYLLVFLSAAFAFSFARFIPAAAIDMGAMQNLIWRYHWILPVPLILSVLFTALFSLKVPVSYRNSTTTFLSRASLFVIVGVTLALFLKVNLTPLQNLYGTDMKLIKLPSESLNVARQVVQSATEDDHILAEQQLSEIIPMLPSNARLFSSRPLYWNVSYFTKEETRRRKKMQSAFNQRASLNEENAQKLMAQIVAFGVNKVVIPADDGLVVSPFYQALNASLACKDLTSSWIVCSD